MGNERRHKTLFARHAYRHELARVSRGFTLAETLIALGISSLIAMALVSILSVTMSMKSAVSSRITERVIQAQVKATLNEAFRDVRKVKCDGAVVTLAVPEEETIMLRGSQLVWNKRRPYGISQTVTIASNVRSFLPRIEYGSRGMEAVIISLQLTNAAIEYVTRYMRKP